VEKSTTYGNQSGGLFQFICNTPTAMGVFVSKTYRSLMKLCRIKQQVSTAYHPETDGETEQVNRELKVYLQIFCKRIPEDWDKHLPITEFSYNG